MHPIFRRRQLLGCVLLSTLAPFSRAQPTPVTPYVFTTVAGAAAIGSTDGASSVARFNFPEGIAVDSTGNIYVADAANHTIRKITATGVVSTLAGKAGYATDPNDSTYGNGAGSAARFTEPFGVVTDAAGNVYVAGGFDNAIRKITPAGVVTTVAGGGPTSPFNVPEGIAIDAGGNLFVTDTYHCAIRKITPAGVVTLLAGGTAGSADGNGAAAQFRNPRGIAVDSSGTVYVADTFNHTIRKITPAGDVTTFAGVTYVAGYGDGLGTAAKFSYPTGLTIDPAGNLYVADSSNFIIRKITPSGAVTTFAGAPGTAGHGDGNGAITARFFNPVGVAVDATGNVFVADNRDQCIRKVSPSSFVSTVAGLSPLQSIGSVDGAGINARFRAPDGVAVGPAGELYVADSQSHTVRKILPDGTVSTLAGAPNTPDYVDGAGSAARFHGPVAVAVDSAANVYVADGGNYVIRKITPGGVVSTVAGQPGVRNSVDGPVSTASLGYLSGVAVDASGNLYVSEDRYLRKITPAGQVTTIHDFPPPYRYLSDVTVDAAGNVYAADAGHGEVAKLTTDGALLEIMPAQFLAARIAADRTGNVFYAARLHHQVWKRAPDGTLSVIGGLFDAKGSADGVGDAARFQNPTGIAVDGADNVYVTCNAFEANTVRKGQPAGPPVITSQPQSMSVPQGLSVQFAVTATGLPAPTYQWYFNGAPFNGATSNTLTLGSVQMSDAGSYVVVATNAVGIVSSNAATLTVTAAPASPPPPPPSSSGSSGGGAMSEWFVLALVILGAARAFGRRR